MGWETVIGLEVHVELSTKSQIFCGCGTAFGSEPNSNTCPGCLSYPGTLPVLNKKVCEKAIAAGLALGCEIEATSLFDRKHYFYPDLTKGYQLSQYYRHLCKNGIVSIDNKDIRVNRIHIEEDAGKLVHEAGFSLVDGNRGGMALIEIVSEPDLRSADEAEAYLEALRETLVYCGVSECKMQEGSMRADVNVSVREEGSELLGVRSEIKNLNSIKAIRRAIEYEKERHIEAIETGQPLVQETRRWDDNIGKSFSMRSKETAQEYLYFPDPDQLALYVDEEWIARVKNSLPELPAEKRSRYVSAFGVSPKTAAVLTAEKNTAELFESIVTSFMKSCEKNGLTIKEAASEAANIVTGDILRLVRESGAEADKIRVDAEKLSTILKLVRERKIGRAAGREATEMVYNDDIDPISYVEEKNLSLIDDEEGIYKVARKVLADNPQSVEDIKNGKDKAFGFLVGQTMRAFEGKADPETVNKTLKKLIGEGGIMAVPAQEKKKAEKTLSSKEIDTRATRSRECSVDLSFSPSTNRRDFSGRVANDSILKTSEKYRDMKCDELRPEHIGQTVRLAGWVMTIRDHGGIVFIDLYDQYGVTQISCTDDQIAELGREYSISVKGKVLARDPETFNPNIATGEVEIRAEEVVILGPCRSVLPFEIDQSRETREDLRLKYRYLDLRNPKLKENMILRSDVIKQLRKEMEELGFMEIQTPILANSSPEGARDYLVPSRKHKGKFYALPQAPQQFKQLLMVSGFDRYFQIAPCFRDEDARLDRSPGEFYQLDFEMAYATQDDVFAVAERVLTSTFKSFSDKKVSPPPYRRLTFAETMLKYGTDKPDLRNPLEIIDLSEFFVNVDFAPFKGKVVRAVSIPAATGQSRSWFKDMEKFALSIGMKGLGYITVKDDGTYKGPIDKFLTDPQKQELRELAELKAGDVLYFISDEPGTVAGLAGQIRSEAAKRLGLIDEDRFEFCFITDYPMYEYNDETNKIEFTHNPFSMPQGEMEALMTKDPLDILAWQYDIVCNGVELSSGAVRNHRPDIMVKAFEIAGYSEKDVEQKFGALYNAFSYGAPPHAGMAPGVDRIIMLLAGEENIREIIAFPLNSNAQNLMLDAPSEVTEQQLREDHIKIR